jgi:hypothetical protein
VGSPTPEEIEDRFRHHPPTAEAERRHALITEASIAFAKVVAELVPFSQGQSTALTKIVEARMHANEGIARNHHLLVEMR